MIKAIGYHKIVEKAELEKEPMAAIPEKKTYVGFKSFDGYFFSFGKKTFCKEVSKQTIKQ